MIQCQQALANCVNLDCEHVFEIQVSNLCAMRLAWLLELLLVLASCKMCQIACAAVDKSERREAYATLLYDEQKYLDGVRVLGRSIRETGTDRCLLVSFKT